MYPSLKNWLQGINLGSLLPKFIESGYDNYEELLFLMTTPYAVTDLVLENDIGVTKLGHRQRILLKLYMESQAEEAKKKAVIIDMESNKSACEMCILM